PLAAAPITDQVSGHRWTGVHAFASNRPPRRAVELHVLRNVDIGIVRGRIREARACTRGSHDIADEGGRPCVIAVTAVLDLLAVLVMHAGPRGFAAFGILTEPPVFPDPLPGPGSTVGLFVRLGVGVGTRRIVIDGLAEQAPFLRRNRD